MVAGRELRVLSFTRYGKNHIAHKGGTVTLCNIPTRGEKAIKLGVRLCVKCRKITEAYSWALPPTTEGETT